MSGDRRGRWEPQPIETIQRIVVGSHDTPIEMRFRALLLRWAKSKGAVVSIQATSHGDSAKIIFPQSLGDLRWTLAPQVTLGGVQANFVLTSVDHEVPRIACSATASAGTAPSRRTASPRMRATELACATRTTWSGP